MTAKSISLLKNHDKGFFLQVEGASIDKRDHAADACGQIGETVSFDAAVKVALAFAKADGNTSVFVTADHGHTSQIVETGSNTPGLTVTLETADKAPMTLSYGTAAAGESQEHTGTQVRIAGYGPQAANIVGLTDQTDLHFTIARALGLKTPAKG
jgi:alkaline phosphatase